MKLNQKGIINLQIAIVTFIAVMLIGLSGWRVLSVRNSEKTSDVASKAEVIVESTSQTEPTDINMQQNSVPKPDNKQSTPSVSSNTTTPQASPAPTEPPPNTTPVTYDIIYQIQADGTSAVSPTTATLSSSSGVNITVDLKCNAQCNFKLIAEGYPFSNTATYTSTQKITYSIDKPGHYILYNEFNPSIKTKLMYNP